MEKNIQEWVETSTGASSIESVQMVQSLWGKYGKLLRINLGGSEQYASVIVKQIQWGSSSESAKACSQDFSHRRKLKSYEIEGHWYQHFAHHCDEDCRIPAFIAHFPVEDGVLFMLEDLNSAGFDRKKSNVTSSDMQACLHWLANFHACFMGTEPDGLWKVGTYWHLETRPHELSIMSDLALKTSAFAIDHKLKSAKFQTLVHGDAKLENFCFHHEKNKVAAVDFQYVGGGCGIKDVAYFIDSCLPPNECERMERPLLDFYFESLATAVSRLHPQIDTDDLEAEWRSLFPVAWTDFYRFLKGWSPNFWNKNAYSEMLARETMATL